MMLVDVTLLRRQGLRLRPPELDPPVRGELETSWMSQTSFGRPMMIAQVYAYEGTSRRALLHLGDVALEAIVDGGFSLSGVELVTAKVEGEARVRVSEYRQVWRCVPVA